MSHRSYKIYKSYHFYLSAVVCAALILAAVFGALFSGNAQAAAGINTQFNYQGKLTNSTGAAVSDGAYDFVFKLYTASSGGSAIWTETWNATTRFTSTVTGTPPSSGGTSVTYTDDATESYLAVGDTLYNNTAGDEVVIEAFNTTANTITISPTSKAWAASDSITTKISARSGLFSARLGSISSLSSINLNQTPLYLGVAVGADSEMTPRKRITAVLQAFQANKLDGILSSTSTTGASEYGSTITVSDTGIVTTGADTTYGLNVALTRTGATGGTINSYGIYSAVTADTGGTSTAVGGYFSATGADNNYGLIVENGNVGIGTASPAAPLHISASPASNRGQLSLTDASGGVILMTFYESSSYLGSIHYDPNNTNFYFQNYNTGSYGNIILNSEGGNVGIGTASPSHKLQITDTNTTASRAGLYVAQSGAITGTGYGIYAAKTGASTTNVAGYFSATGATNNYGLIVENGNVGIGTTGPSASLHIYKNVADYVITRIQNPNTAGTNYLSLQNDTIETALSSFGSAVSGNFGTTGLAMANLGVLEFSARGLIDTVGNNQLYLGTNRYVRMTIDGTGNVGIGNTSPSEGLEVGSTTAGKNAKITATLGSNIVTNGAFTADLTGWSGTNWSWSSGTALHTAGSTSALTQATATVAAGSTYKVEYQVTGVTAGSVTMSVGGVSDAARASSSTFTTYITAITTTALAFTPTSDFNGAIDNVLVQLLTNGTGDLTIDGNLIVKSPIKDGSGNDAITLLNGNVGIGTNSPLGKLHVQLDSDTDYSATTRGNIGLFVRNATLGASNYSKINLTTEVNGEVILGAVENAGNTAADFVLQQYSGSAYVEYLRVLGAGGNVGIGTNNPEAALQINRNSASAASIIRLRDDNETAGSWWDLANPAAAVGSFGIKRYESSASVASKSLFITSGGNYGIGDTGPTAKLSVNGNVVIGAAGATGPASGLYVIGNTGLGVQSPANRLDVSGALAVGSAYAGTAAPTNGAIIEGSVGIGTTSASAGKLVIAQTDAANLQALTIDTEESTGTQNVFSVISDSGSDENTVLNLTAAGNLSIDGSLTTGGASTVYADGSITKSTGSALSINLGGAAGDDFIVDTSTLVVESDNDRVGIGTTGPSASLHIYKNVADYVVTRIQNPNTAGTNYLSLQNDTIETALFSFGSAVSGNFGTTGLAMANLGVLEFGARGLIDTVGNNQLYLGTNRYVRMTIDGTGNVGIGTTGPSSKLDVTTAGLGTTQTTSSGLALVNTTAAAAGAQQISPAVRWSGFGWKTDATAASQAVDFRAYVTPVQGASAPTGYLGFGSSVNGAAYNDGQLVLTTAGNVGIGTTSPNQGKMEVKGDTVCVDTNSDDNATSCIAAESDARLKTNIAVISGALDIVSKLRGVSFDWKIDDPEVLVNYPLINRFASNPHSAGLIAQEVETVFPLALALETVGGEARYLQLDYQKFTPLMIEAIKELNEKVEELKKQVSPELDSSVVLSASGESSLSDCQLSNVNCQMSYWLINSATGRIAPTLDLDLGGKSIHNIGGLFASGGKWKLAEDGYLEIEKIIAKEIETEKLKIGALDLPAGITLYDLLTKEPYCLYIENGEIKKQGGECDNQPTDANTEPINTNNNETQPAADNDQQSATGEQQPESAADNLQQPEEEINGAQGETDNQQPAGGDQQPAADSQEIASPPEANTAAADNGGEASGNPAPTGE